MKHEIVDQETWTARRLEHMAKEKEFTRLRDELSKERRELPWVKVDKDYSFQTTVGVKSLADLFGGNDQLVVYHFMYGADWEAGCKSCSFWADNINGLDVHLNARNIAIACVSIAPLETLQNYRKRMGWTFDWVSSEGSDFNHDFGVSFTDDEQASGQKLYNFGTTTFGSNEAPGATAFFKDEDGSIYRTYSTFSRGLDMLNVAYHYMDIAPLGRDEQDLDYSMAWLRRRDEY